MQFNKCCRCGAFFISSGDVCPNCSTKDNFEMQKLKNFLDEADSSCSMESISSDTGISVKNLNRYFSQDKFSEYKTNNNIVEL